MDNRHNTNSGSTPTTTVRFDANLINAIHARHSNKYTRSEAFVYLLEKVLEANRSGNTAPQQQNTAAIHNVQTSQKIDKPFVTNYSQLAKTWRWDRKTVAIFIKEIETCGVILTEHEPSKLILWI